MSLILEALKKSEDKRRLGAAPDLATPFSAPRRRSWVWPLAALIIVAGVVAWALRPSPSPPPTPAAVVPPKTKTPVAQAAPLAGQKTGAPLRSVTGNNDLVQAAPPDNLPKPEAHPANETPSGQFVFGQPTTNAPAGTGPSVEDRRAARAAARERRGGQPSRNAPAVPAATMPVPGAVGAAPRANAAAAASIVGAKSTAPSSAAPSPPAAVAAAPKAGVVTPPPAAPVAQQPAASPQVASTPPVAGAPARAPKTTATVGLPPASAPAASPKPTPAGAAASAQPYSELPFSVRKSLPELKLSMHVYASEPSQRFVVLNDSRLTEGEKTTDDIVVHEIRPDGVVLEFQSQRFFFPRDGL